MAQRKAQRAKAAKAAAENIDKEALQAHTAAFAMNYSQTGICTKAIERLATRETASYIPAEHVAEAASALEMPTQHSKLTNGLQMGLQNP